MNTLRLMWRKTPRWVRVPVSAACLLLALAVMAFAGLSWVSPFPLDRMERWPASPRVTDRTGRVLLTQVADDDQWRFPVPLDDISPWVVQATIAVEDERFRRHHGIDPIAVARATGQNVGAGRVKSGASTLTMQICRMMDDRPRTWRSKLVEVFRAVQLERERDKSEILATYLNMAPYGGNLRGVEAAARVYFDKSAADLTLGEAALLAGLPQSPTKYRPDRHLETARARQGTVLRRMRELGMISEEQALTATNERLVIRRAPTTMLAPHAAWLALKNRPGGGRTTLDAALQADVQNMVRDHARNLPDGAQTAVVIIDIASAEIRAMVGSAAFDAPMNGQVNGAIAQRAAGSSLKPFIYAAAFDARRLGPESILHDGPIQRAGWSPKNFDQQFAGDVTVAEALRRSLNIPAILAAEDLGVTRCAGAIEAAGIDLPEDAAARAGLALAVGAVEISLLDLTNGYATFGREGIRYTPRLFTDAPYESAKAFDPNTCAAINEILSSRKRRPAGMADLRAGDVPWFMWKTGTSSRRRDAWAAGHNQRFAIGVWVGRFAGAGSPEFVGGKLAEPLLARMFDHPALRTMDAPLPAAPWITTPVARTAASQARLEILHPADGAILFASDATCAVQPRATKDVSFWFLDGVLTPMGESQYLQLPPGHHELRCMDAAGKSAAVTFTVNASLAKN